MPCTLDAGATLSLDATGCCTETLITCLIGILKDWIADLQPRKKYHFFCQVIRIVCEAIMLGRILLMSN